MSASFVVTPKIIALRLRRVREAVRRVDELPRDCDPDKQDRLIRNVEILSARLAEGLTDWLEVRPLLLPGQTTAR